MMSRRSRATLATILLALAGPALAAALVAAPAGAVDEFTLRKVRSEGNKLILYHDPRKLPPDSRVLVRLDRGGCSVDSGSVARTIAEVGESYATLVVIDRGGTKEQGMGRYSSAVLNGVRGFLENELGAGGGREYAIIDSHGSGGSRTQPLTARLGDLKAFLAAAPPPSGSGADIYSTTERGLTVLEQSPRPLRAVVIISDGYDPKSRGDDGPRQLITRAQTLGVPVYALIVDRPSWSDHETNLQAGARSLTKVAGETFGLVIRTVSADAQLEAGIRDALTGFAQKLHEIQRTECTLCGPVGGKGEIEAAMFIHSGGKLASQSRSVGPGNKAYLVSVSGLDACRCDQDDACPAGEVCAAGACAAPCQSDAQCACGGTPGGTCSSGRCKCPSAGCKTNDDCVGAECVDGKCAAAAEAASSRTIPTAIGVAAAILGGLLLWIRERRRRAALAAHVAEDEQRRAQKPAPIAPTQPDDPPAGLLAQAPPKPVNGPSPAPPSPPYRLLPKSGSVAPIPLRSGESSIGADPSSTIRFEAPTVSGRHARLEINGHRLMLTDLQSSNGTFVNRARLRPNAPVEIRPGDEIGFSQSEVWILAQTEPPTRSAPKGRTSLEE